VGQIKLPKWATGTCKKQVARRVARQRGIGLSRHWARRGADLPALDDSRRITELERKIGQLTMENDFLKKSVAAFQGSSPPARR
jgi:hypothetical protein